MARRTKKNNKNSLIIAIVVVLVLTLLGCMGTGNDAGSTVTTEQSEAIYTTDEGSVEATSEENNTTEVYSTTEGTKADGVSSLKGELPRFEGEAYVVINNNEPTFSADEITDEYFEIYEPLDRYGRCTVAFACLGKETMPTEERGAIGSVKPTGWHTVKYDCVDGKYLYNRCHLIGFQLSGENANKRNLITGTRYMNVDGMLPFENMVADYIEETGNHVMYRATPVFEGDDLVARGVQIEAYSVEDEGDGICFNVFCFNAQPGVVIDYATGESVAE